MNQVILIGRLTKDPEVRQTQSGSEVAKYTLAVDRFGDGTDFINCTAFGKTAEFAEKYFTKGMKVAVSGRIQTGKYEKDGRTVYTTDVIVNNQEFCESRKEEHSDADFMRIPDMDDNPFMDLIGGKE